MIVIDDADGSDFFHAWGATQHIEADYIECVNPVDPFLVRQRNESITKAWACEDRRKRQSLSMKAKHAAGGFPHSDPNYRDRIAQTMRKVYECPSLRAKASVNKQAYWDSNPQAKAAIGAKTKAYWAKRRAEKRTIAADQ